MDNRSQLLTAIEKWKAFRRKPPTDQDDKERGHAHAAYESALHAAGVYKEALRGQRVLSEELRTHSEEPERTFYYWAYQCATYAPEALKALHKAKSYSGRTVILDDVQTAFAKARQKTEAQRKVACQSRTLALIEEAKAQAMLAGGGVNAGGRSRLNR